MFDKKSTFYHLAFGSRSWTLLRVVSFTVIVTVCLSRLCSSGPHCTSRWYSAARPVRPIPPETYTWTSWTPRRPSEAEQRRQSPKRSNWHSATREPPLPPRAAQENRLEQSGEKNPGWKHSKRALSSKHCTAARLTVRVVCLDSLLHVQVHAQHRWIYL